MRTLFSPGKRLEYLSFFCILAISLTCFASCRTGGGDYFSWQNASACAEISGTICGVEFCADVTLGAKYADGERDFVMVYRKPDVLQDLTVKCEGGIVKVENDEFEAGGAGAEFLSLPARAFAVFGVASNVRQEKENGTTLTVYEVTDNNLGATVALDANGTPRKITLRLNDGREAEISVNKYLAYPAPTP